MVLTLTAVAEPSNNPPRVLLTATESDPAYLLSSCQLFRNGVAIRFAPTLAGSVALAYDYDAPFDTSLLYRADATEVGIVADWTETWASTAAWTAGGSGAGWSAAAGVASAAADGSTIYRDLSGLLASLVVTTPTNITIELLDSAALIVGSVRVAPDGTVTVAGKTSASVAGSGTFTLTVSGSSLTVAGTGWSTSVDLSGSATRVRLVSPSTPSYLTKFGTFGIGNSNLKNPHGFAIDGSGNIWVTDSANNQVKKFDSAGTWLLTIGKSDRTSGTGNGEFNQPSGVAVDGSGNVFVADASNHRVQKFNSAGTYQSKFGSNGTGNGQFDTPLGIKIDGSGNIFVADYKNHRVQKFNSAGTYQSKFGTNGTGNGQFKYPSDVAIDGSGNIFVTDSQNHRVQKFNSAGTYQSQFGSNGTGNGKFNSPLGGIAFDGSGNIWVCDTGNHRVQKFNSAGTYLSQFGSYGTSNGQFASPIGFAFDGSGNIWVSELLNNRLQKFTTAGATVDDIATSIVSDAIAVSASDTQSLTGISTAWLTNAAQPDLALEIEGPCESSDFPYYMTEDTGKDTSNESSAVELPIEGSADYVNVVTGPRKAKKWTLEVACQTLAAWRDLDALLANNAPVNLRLPAAMADLGLDEGFFTVGDTSSHREEGPRLDQLRTLLMPLTPARPPAFDALWEWNMNALAQTGMTMDQANAVFDDMVAMLIGPTS